MTISITIPEIAEKYMRLQCNGVLADYTECPELNHIHDFLKKLSPPKFVLELGAGLGRVSVYLRKAFAWKQTKFHLLDGNSGEDQIAGMNYKSGDSFYNSLDATRTFCNVNDIDNEHLCLINAEKPIELYNNIYDLCYSCKAIGFHWPINDHLDTVLHSIKSGGHLFFELRSTKEICYRDPKRVERAKRFVDYQLNYIDKYKDLVVEFCKTNITHPIILLRKV